MEQGFTMVSLQTSGSDYPRFVLHTLAHVMMQMINKLNQVNLKKKKEIKKPLG